jgi:hypothetical protein
VARWRRTKRVVSLCFTFLVYSCSNRRKVEKTRVFHFSDWEFLTAEISIGSVLVDTLAILCGKELKMLTLLLCYDFCVPSDLLKVERH